MIFISSHSRAASDKVPFEIRARVIRDSGNTDMVFYYQEFTARPESITGWKGRGVSVDKLWTHLSTDATTATFMCIQHTVMDIQTHSRLCVWLD